LKTGESATITLPGLGTAGYRWSFTVDDPRLVLVERRVAERQPGDPPPSRSVDEQFVVTGLNAGETVVRFSQARSFEPSKPPIATRDVMVRVGGE